MIQYSGAGIHLTHIWFDLCTNTSVHICIYTISGLTCALNLYGTTWWRHLLESWFATRKCETNGEQLLVLFGGQFHIQVLKWLVSLLGFQLAQCCTNPWEMLRKIWGKCMKICKKDVKRWGEAHVCDYFVPCLCLKVYALSWVPLMMLQLRREQFMMKPISGGFTSVPRQRSIDEIRRCD